MGYMQNLAVGASTITPAKPRVGLDRQSAEALLSHGTIAGNPGLPATYDVVDEVQIIPEQTTAGVADTYTLTIDLPNLAVGTFTTAAIAYDAVDTAIETAIDSAATTAAVTGWTNADISVSMAGAAGLDDGTVTLTFDGASVTGQPVTLIDLTATGWTEDGTITRSVTGQVARNATKALFDMNVIAGALQGSGEAPTWTKPDMNGRARPGTNVIRDLALQTIVEDGTEDAYDAIVALYPQVAKP
jgi:hypothetical protein